MAKARTTVFFCQNCGYESAKWMGQCPACHEWNTFAEESVTAAKAAGKGSGKPTAGVVQWDSLQMEAEDLAAHGQTAGKGKRKGQRALPLKEISISDTGRMSTGIAEMDRVLGGGLVQGSLVLVGGDPGIGKSTLLLQVCRNLTAPAGASKTEAVRVLYVSGEESQQQIKMRANRMGAFGDSLLILCETNLTDVQEAIVRTRPTVVVIDSIQTMYNENVSSAPGSVSQVRETTGLLLQLAKGLGVTIFIVGHVTKEGAVAGPRVLEHMVDTVLYFEGDRHASYRILHGVKNRFGSTDEIGVFEMKQDGLREVPNPSEFMLDGRPTGSSGSVVACSVEGTRPILIEVQALTARSNLAYPRRTTEGADNNRVNLLLAILERRLGLRLSDMDVYVNIAGGVRLREPAVDLGIVVAVISSFKDIVIDEKTLVFGEVGLSGEIRSVPQAPLRVKEAQKLGFSRVILPQASIRSVQKAEGVQLVGVRNVRELINVLTA
jgi:DNA repair protein RadA/Sms